MRASPRFTGLTTAHGIGLVELLVAMTIMSIALTAGFSLFLSVQRDSIESQNRDKRVRAAHQASDTIMLEFDDAFFDGTHLVWPQIRNDDVTQDGRVLVTEILGNQKYVDGATGIGCPVDNISASTVTFGVNCVTSAAGDMDDFKQYLVHQKMPTVLPTHSQQGCVIADVDNVSASEVTLTVRNPECLLTTSNTAIPIGSALLFPRIVARAANYENLLALTFFDQFNEDRIGASISFGFVEEWRQDDPSVTQMVTSADIDAATPTRLQDLTGTGVAGFNRVFDPHFASDMHLYVTTDKTIYQTSGATGSSSLTLPSLANRAALQQALDNLSIRSDNGSIELTFHLAADNMSWSRVLQIVEAAP
ncbi:hypothetical protein N9368_01960 [Alphaproteobacteria bacterium]|nr:hypothetical protein [Alphaproteobacteria bacterium]